MTLINKLELLLHGHGAFVSGFSDALVKDRYEEASLSHRDAFEEKLSGTWLSSQRMAHTQYSQLSAIGVSSLKVCLSRYNFGVPRP